MTTRSCLVIAALAALVLAGCTKVSSKFCEMNPDDARCAAPDAFVPLCENDPDCASPTPVCRLDTRTCVQCVGTEQDDECASGTPVCGDDNRCRACTAHSECASAVCLPNGECAAPSVVAYVAPAGSGSACMLDLPCGSVSVAQLTGRPYIKLASGLISDDKLTLFDEGTVTMFADPGAQLTRTTSGPILEIKETGTELTIYDLEIRGGIGSSGHALSMSSNLPKLTLNRVLLVGNDGYGVSSSSGVLTMTRSVVVGNALGGVNASMTDFYLTSNVFAANGNPTNATTGGLTLSQASASYLFAFNTVADNSTTTVAVATRGLSCPLGMNVSNNIFSNNRVSSMCTVTYSLFDAGTTIEGTNLAGDPNFKNVDPTMPRSPTFYRIGAGSPAKNAADINATVTIDIDGDARPQDGQSDIGADEFVP